MKCKQLIFVKSIGNSATIYLLSDKQIVAEFLGFIGAGGTTLNKREGDKKTPVGLFTIDYAFGFEDMSIDMPYRKVTPDCVFIDDVNSPMYNTWQFSGKGERLCEFAVYKYALCIGYNKKRVKGAGSAIFMHISEGKSTAGCIALDEPDMLYVMNWLRKDKYPHILIE